MPRAIFYTVGSPLADPSTKGGRDALFGDYRLGYRPTPGTDVGVLSSVSRSTLTGDQIITTAGTVMENRIVVGNIDVRAANVIIRNCLVQGSATAPTGARGVINAIHANCSNLLVQDCDIVPSSPSYWYTGILGHDYTAERVYVKNTVDGFGAYNASGSATQAQNNAILKGFYVDEQGYWSPSPTNSDNQTHCDGVQVQGGSGFTALGGVWRGRYSQTIGTAPTTVATNNPYIFEDVLLKGTVGGNITNVEVAFCWLEGSVGGFVIPTLGTGDGSTFDLHDNEFEKRGVFDCFRITTSHSIPGFTNHAVGKHDDTNNSNTFADGTPATYNVATEW